MIFTIIIFLTTNPVQVSSNLLLFCILGIGAMAEVETIVSSVKEHLEKMS